MLGVDQCRDIVHADEFFESVDPARRVDQRNPLTQRNDLRPTQFGFDCRQLAIDVRLGDMIHIDQRHRTNRTARKCLHDPRANTADTHHAYAGRRQPRQPLPAVESLNSTEPPLEIQLPITPQTNYPDGDSNRAVHRAILAV